MAKKRVLLTKTYKQLQSYMCFIANSAGMCFPEWRPQNIGEHIFSSRRSTKEHMIGFIRNEMNISELTDEEYEMLGFAKWDNEGDWLIPVWLFNLLPDGTELYCPIDKTNAKVGDEDTDDDYRMGCVGYSLVKT